MGPIYKLTIFLFDVNPREIFPELDYHMLTERFVKLVWYEFYDMLKRQNPKVSGWAWVRMNSKLLIVALSVLVFIAGIGVGTIIYDTLPEKESLATTSLQSPFFNPIISCVENDGSWSESTCSFVNGTIIDYDPNDITRTSDQMSNISDELREIGFHPTGMSHGDMKEIEIRLFTEDYYKHEKEIRELIGKQYNFVDDRYVSLEWNEYTTKDLDGNNIVPKIYQVEPQPTSPTRDVICEEYNGEWDDDHKTCVNSNTACQILKQEFITMPYQYTCPLNHQQCDINFENMQGCIFEDSVETEFKENRDIQIITQNGSYRAQVYGIHAHEICDYLGLECKTPSFKGYSSVDPSEVRISYPYQGQDYHFKIIDDRVFVRDFENPSYTPIIESLHMIGN